MSEIKSVSRACDLLDEAARLGAFGLSDMARALDLPTSTVERLALTLEAKGYLARRQGGWKLGPSARAIWANGVKALKNRKGEIDAELKRLEVEGA